MLTALSSIRSSHFILHVHCQVYQPLSLWHNVNVNSSVSQVFRSPFVVIANFFCRKNSLKSRLQRKEGSRKCIEFQIKGSAGEKLII